MELLILILVAAVLGYFLARSRYSKNVDSATEQVTETSRNLVDKTGDWWRRQFNKGQYADALRGWAAGPNGEALTADFKTWLAGLSESEAEDFTRELFKYLSGLGYDLPKIVNGEVTLGLEQRQVFVETIVVYSQAYRKAKEAQKQPAEGTSGEASESAPASDGKVAAEKSPSRRKSDSGEASAVA